MITRWLRFRGASVEPLSLGVLVDLPPDDPLIALLGERFRLLPASGNTLAAADVEPVYPGCRIADLCAGDLEAVHGTAVVTGTLPGRREPIFVFSYAVVFQTDQRSEQLFQVALTNAGEETAMPPEPEEPLQSAGPAEPWRLQVQKLVPTADGIVHARAASAASSFEHAAQRRLYLLARRLAAYYQSYRLTTDQADPMSDYRRRLIEEAERHHLRITITPIGVMVYVTERNQDRW